jgi:predicted porin
MKKSLLALAVAAALPAFAYAQTNIILNGSVDVALEHVNDESNGGNGSDLRVTNGVWSGSRFAISGTEELGGGLKGIFNVEHRMSPDTGTVTNGDVPGGAAALSGVTGGNRNQFWAGQSWVGIQGGFGAIRLGRQYSPMFRALAGGDVTGYSWYNNLAGANLGGGGAIGGWTLRLANDVSYQSPSIGGFTIHAAYAPGEDATDPVDRKLGDTYGIGAVGAFGPINIGLAYHNIDAGDTAGPGSDDGTELGLSLGAKFGNFGIGLAGVQTENFAGIKRKGYYASLSAGVGAGTVYLVGSRDDRGGDDIDNTGLALTYSHGLSKRTFVYASLGYNKIEAANGNETKPKAVALGIRHFF